MRSTDYVSVSVLKPIANINCPTHTNPVNEGANLTVNTNDTPLLGSF